MTGLALPSEETPLLLFGGPYGNLQATEALRRQAQQLGIAPGNIICTGDVAAYCAQPNETIALLREWGVRVLMGNCEESLAEDAADCGCGFAEGTQCRVLSDNWYRYNRDSIQPQHKEWMATLPHRIDFTYLGKRFTVVHGGFEQINQFVFASTGSSIKSAQLSAAQADGIIAGHCGLPFTDIIDGRLWHNPGVIGMPANDGTPRVWYSLWTPCQGRIQIEHRSLLYDAQQAAQIMRRAGLKNGYADALTSGLWPSMDVLPATERARRGQAIEESQLWFDE